MPGAELHYVQRTAWLRAAVLGANDGIISTASLIMGVAAAPGARTDIHRRGRRLGGGRDVEAAGEYVSVSSQADSEAADLGAGTARAQRAARPRRGQEPAHIYEDSRPQAEAGRARSLASPWPGTRSPLTRATNSA